jgi:hypothetical protein
MSDNSVAGIRSGDPLNVAASALETAVQAAKDGAADARAAVEKALPAASRFLSRFVYTTSYTFSYGIVFPAVLIAKSIPSDNALVHGLVDGARAATDAVDQWKSSHVGSSLVDSASSLHS